MNPMTSVSDGPSPHATRPVPGAPLVVVDPADQVHVDVVAVGPGKPTLVPVLVLPSVSMYVDPCSTSEDAADWWTDLAVAAGFALLCYQGEGETSR